MWTWHQRYQPRPWPFNPSLSNYFPFFLAVLAALYPHRWMTGLLAALAALHLHRWLTDWFTIVKDCLLTTGQKQACTRITQLFGWLVVCHHAKMLKILLAFVFLMKYRNWGKRNFAKKNIFDWWKWTRNLGFGHFQRFLHFFLEWQKIKFILTIPSMSIVIWNLHAKSFSMVPWC